jgi:hygromycin-B 4-O-kinase
LNRTDSADSVGPRQVRAFLNSRVGPDLGRIIRIRHGHWSRAFLVHRDGGPLVVRFSANDSDFAKDAAVAGHTARAFPVPTVIETGRAFDGFYAISEHITGVHLDDLDGNQLRRALPDLLTTLDTVRRLDLNAINGFGDWGADGQAPYPTWRAYLLDVGTDRPTDRTTGWRRRLAASAFGTTMFDDCLRRFETLVHECPEHRYLVHGDLLNYNVLLHADRVAALLDWGWAKHGDFLYDIARLCFWSADYPRWGAIDFAAAAWQHYRVTGTDVPGFAERLRCYQVHVGLLSQVHRAFRGQWARFDVISRRTLDIARANGR